MHLRALTLSLLLTGCATTVSQTSFTIQQTGLAPGMSAPLLGGPSGRAGRGFLLGGAQAGIASGGPSIADGGTGGVIADDGGRVGAGYSGGWWEIAGAFELRPGNWAHAGASDVSNAFRSTTLVYPTIAVRFSPIRQEHFEFGITTELSVAVGPYSRSVSSVTDTTTYFPNAPPQSGESMGTSSQSGTVAIPIFRTGLTLSFIYGPFALSMGVLMATQPYFTAVQTTTQSCVNDDCSGQTADDVPIVDYAFALVPYIGPSLALGDSSRIGLQLFGNISSNAALTQVSPLGGELTLRAQF
jgi:hypothetical protein